MAQILPVTAVNECRETVNKQAKFYLLAFLLSTFSFGSVHAQCGTFDAADFEISAPDAEDFDLYDLITLNYTGSSTLDSLHVIVTETTTSWTDSTTTTQDADWYISLGYLSIGQYEISLRPYCGGQAASLVSNTSDWTFNITCSIENAGVVIDEVTFDPICNGSTTVTITASATCGGDETFEYYIDDPDWNNLNDGYETYSNVTPGWHTFTVVNVNNSKHADTLVYVGTKIQLTLTGGNDTLCSNTTDHTVTVVPTGGATPYSYEWHYTDDPNIASTAETMTLDQPHNQAAVTITDNGGCTATDTTRIFWAQAFTEETETEAQSYGYGYTFHRSRNAVSMQMPLTIDGQIFSSDETHSINYQSTYGCDSIVSIELSVIGDYIAFPSEDGGALDTLVTEETTILYDDGVNSSWYGLNRSRSVTLHAETGNTIKVELTNDELSMSDQIIVTDGGNTVVYTHEGNNIPLQSASGYLTLTFVSGSERGQGFELTVSKVPVSCLPPYNITHTRGNNNATLTWQHRDTPESYEVTVTDARWNNTNGQYDTVFTYTRIVTEPTITIDSSDIQGYDYCHVDILAICGAGDTSEVAHDEFQFYTTDLTIPTTGNNSWTFQEDIQRVTIYDAGGPTGSYEAESDGYLLLEAAPGKTLRIVSGTYDMESDYDFLTVTDDPDNWKDQSYQHRQYLSGEGELEAMTSLSRQLKFTLTSDYGTNESGCEIVVEQVDMPCLPFYTEPTMQFVGSNNVPKYTIYDLVAYGEANTNASAQLRLEKMADPTDTTILDVTETPYNTLAFVNSYYIQARHKCGDDTYTAWGPKMKASACHPVELTLDNASPVSLSLSWTDNGAEAYIIGYREMGQNMFHDTIVTSTSLELTALHPSTTYELSTASICSESDTGYFSATIEMSTACGFTPGLADGEALLEIPEPFRFDETEDGETPSCWTRIAYQDIYPGMTNYDDIHALQFKTNADDDHYAVMPIFDTAYGSMDKWVIHFTPELTNLENLSSEVCIEDTATIIVGVMTDPSDAGTFTAVQTVTVVKSATTEVLVPLRGYSGSGLYPAFKMPAGSGHEQTDLLVSDVFVIPDGHLEAPTNLRVAPHPTQSDKIVVSWDCDLSQFGYNDDGHDSYIVSIKNLKNGADSTQETYDRSVILSTSPGDVLRLSVAHAFVGARYVGVYGNWFNAGNEQVDYIVPLYDKQDADTIGDLANLSMTSYDMPWSTGDQSGSQMLILESELNGMDNISAIAFRVASGCDQMGFQNATIYMANTELTEFTATGSYTLANYVDYNTMTQVGSANFNAKEGWQTITLTTPFALESGKNLAIAVASNSGDMVNGSMTRFYLDHDSYGKGLKLPGVYDETVTSIPTTYAENPVSYRPQMILFEDKSCGGANDTLIVDTNLCENASLTWRGQTISFSDEDIELHYMKIDSTYSNGRWYNNYGYVYYDTVEGVGAGGCDSIYQLRITKVYNESNDYESLWINDSYVTSCGPYTWRNGETYYESLGGFIYEEAGCPYIHYYAQERVYDTVRGATSQGCDSIYGLNLTVEPYYTFVFDSTGINPGTSMANAYLCATENAYVLPECTMQRDYYEFEGWIFEGDTIAAGDSLSTFALTSDTIYPAWKLDCGEGPHNVTEPTEFCGNSDFVYSWHGHSVTLDYLKANATFDYLGDEIYAFRIFDTVTGARGGVCDSIYMLSLRSDIESFNITSASVCPLGYTWIDDSTYTQNVGVDEFGNTIPASMRYIIDSTNASCHTVNALAVYIDTAWTNYDTITYYYIEDSTVYRTVPVCNDAYYNIIACDTTREGYDFMGWQLVGAPAADTIPAGTQADAQGSAEYYALWQSNCTDITVYDTVTLCSNDTISWHGFTWRGPEFQVGVFDTIVSQIGVIPGECDSIFRLNIAVPDIPTLSIDTVINVSCSGGSNGEISTIVPTIVNAYEHNLTYQFKLDTSEYSTAFNSPNYGWSNLMAGEYKVYVKDGCGLVDSTTVTITEPAPITVDITSYSDSAVCYDAAGVKQLNASATGGNGIYTYMWENDATRTHDTCMVAINIPGTHTVSLIATDTNGCTGSGTYTYTVYDTLNATFSGSDTAYCYGATAAPLTVTATGGSDSYSYQWFNYGNPIDGATEATYYVPTTSASDYDNLTVTVYNDCGEKSFAAPRIVVYDTFQLGPVNETYETYCFNASTQQIEIPINGGGNYTAQWYMNGQTIDGANTNKYIPRSDTAGIFNLSLKVTSNAGCGSDSLSVGEITVYDAVSVTATDQTASYCIDATAVELTATYAGGDGSYSYQWMSINGADTTNVANTASYTPSTSETGYLTYAVITTNNCGSDTAFVANIIVKEPTTSDTTVVACDSYTWIDSITYTSSTSEMPAPPSVTLTNAEGCDSTITLNLTINHATTSDTTMIACDSVWWNGMFYTETPDTTQSYFMAGGNQYGCDSTAFLNLTVNNSIHDYIVETACDSYTFDNVTYTESTDLPTIGDISDNGCPYITHISLTVNHSYHGEDSATACDTYIWNDMELNEGGDHNFESFTADGCDSIITLHLTLHHSTVGIDTQTACDSLVWIDGNTYFSDFTLNDQISFLMEGANQYGCDSTVYLDLTMQDHIYVEFLSDFGDGWMDEIAACIQKPLIVPECAYINEGFVFKGWTNLMSPDTVQPGDTLYLERSINYYAAWTPLCEDVIVFTDTVLCEGSTFFWRGQDFSNQLFSGDYEDVAYAAIENYCDSVFYLRLTVYPVSLNEYYDSVAGTYYWYDEEYTASGTYERHTGYNRYGCDSTEVLHLVIYLGIDNKDNAIDLKVYPNPTSGLVNLEGDRIVSVAVIDMVGRTVATFNDQSQLDLRDLPSGYYTLKIETANGFTTRRIIKR